MTNIFEGLNQARQFAETESRKMRKAFVVAKANVGGLVYKAYGSEDEVADGEKVMVRYNIKGEVVVERQYVKAASEQPRVVFSAPPVTEVAPPVTEVAPIETEVAPIEKLKADKPKTAKAKANASTTANDSDSNNSR